MKNLILFSLCYILFTFSNPLQSQTLNFEKNKEGIWLKENGNPRFFYRMTTKSKGGEYPRANYIHPLYSLDGEPLTEDFPEDHYHHRGIFWTWHQLYVDGIRVADPWLCEGISWEVKSTNTNINDGKAILEAHVYWEIPQLENQAVLKEKVLISYERLEENVYALSFDIDLQALVDNLEIGGSEDAKGYGGFSPRIDLPENIRFSDINGNVMPQNLAVQAGPWINLSGDFSPKTNGITIMGEPEKLPSFQGWILRSAKSMQNMAFPGRKPIKIPKGKNLNIRNRILVHKNLTSKEIEKYYQQFSNKK
ncbi:PmoA family protein [Echinicola jeungdonensis]|uniref:DUF6807 family protein n=1 Tax=Echinicola jeungdonensis TaxID=709343 RepID=A0ABV5J5T5_9BACT|nr:DUF6807 family protein [Echinicola jeungdonensis]MDN3670968.1 PmoA family protein [Echinicola jeungdonensis]